MEKGEAAMTAFSEAFDMVLAFEGGFVDDPKDSGGKTKFGISQAAFPQLDIPNLTIDQAKDIYRNQYWTRVRGDDLPPVIAKAVFDFSVNAGVFKANTNMQQALGVIPDGSIGPDTIFAAKHADARDFIIKFTSLRILHYTKLASFPVYGKGWVTRAINCAITCLTKGI